MRVVVAVQARLGAVRMGSGLVVSGSPIAPVA